jgi:hypothetical protein
VTAPDEDTEVAGGESGGEGTGGSANPPEADRGLADPAEHPEQHAARHTGEGSEAEPTSHTGDDEGNELLDSEEHSDAEGPFGTG